LDNNTEIIELLTALNKKVDKLTNIDTKVGKALHIIAVSEKEERDIQLLQRNNLKLAAKVSEELAALSPKPDTNTPEILSIFDNFEKNELFGDVLGDDYLGGV
jgi:hypothetical protein